MTTRYLMATNRLTGENTVHQYHEDEIYELFGMDSTKLDETGFLVTQRTVWTDMVRATNKRVGQLNMAHSAKGIRLIANR